MILSLIRPKTLFAGLSPCLMAIALASHSLPERESMLHFLLLAFLLCLTAISLQMVSNVANDYFDGINGVDDTNIFTRIGPQRLSHQGPVWQKKIRRFLILLFFATFILGIPLMAQGGTPIILIGLLSLLFSILYSGGPLPLSHLALGEVLAFIFFGPVAVGGSYYLLTKDYSKEVFFFSCMPGLLSASLMGINNLRDIRQDEKVKKHTLATLLGEHKMRLLLAFLIVAANGIPIILLRSQSIVFLCYPLLLLLSFKGTLKSILYDPISSQWNHHLANLGQHLFFHHLLFGLSYVILVR